MERIKNTVNNSIKNIVEGVQNLRFPWQPGAKPHFRMSVVTGDKRGAGTDANVFVIVHDSAKRKSRILEANHTLKDDHERGATTHIDFDLSAGVEPHFEMIEIWRDNWGSFRLSALSKLFFGGKNKDVSDWFLDRVELRITDEYRDHLKSFETNRGETSGETPGNMGGFPDEMSGKTPRDTGGFSDETFGGTPRNTGGFPDEASDETPRNAGGYPDETSNETPRNTSNVSPGPDTDVWVFPVHRWIRKHHHYFIPLYDALLPQDDENRKEFRREELEHKKETYVYIDNGGPIQVKGIPEDENFSEKFFWTFVEKKAKLMNSAFFVKLKTKWKSLEDVKEILKICEEFPQSVEHWKEDLWFGSQRLQGVDNTIIKLCKEIPSEMNVPPNIAELLEGKTLAEAVRQNKIFVCDLSILEGIKGKNDKKIAVPIALFYLNNEKQLLPVLIQLQQEKSDDNHVFTPIDPPNTWLVAKMYYNNAEAQVHQAITHLGFTHLLMEGVCAACHRNLSTSHPIFRLLAPHFLYMIAINKRGEKKLINPGGWVDSTMTQGTEGMMQLMAKQRKTYSFRKTNPIFDFTDRGVLSEEIISYYPYRDDAVKLYKIIRNYVQRIVTRYYDSNERLKEDWEIQNFRQELVSPFPNGTGINGIPGNDSYGFTEVEQLVELLSGIISTCSLGHASANMQQYSQYAFIPNYPGTLTLDPPTTKVEYTDDDILALLPSKKIAVDIVVITKLLSSPITNPLGDFEVQYLYHPKDIEAAEMFRKELQELSKEIGRRNESVNFKYTDLDPKNVPNSISI